MKWRKWHTFGILVTAGLVLAVGGLSTWVTFGKDANWGVWSFVILAALLAALLGVIGHGLVRRVDGAFMDDRFRISLAQLQLAVWTVVVLAAWGAAVFANLGLDKSDVDAFDVSIPSELWLALGISVTSLGGAKLVQAQRAGQSPPDRGTVTSSLTARGADTANWTTRGRLLAHTTPGVASWGDLFASDDATAAAVPDISKIQMFFFTIVLAFGYAVACVDRFATHGDSAITGLPALNESFVILLGISQGAYLTKKTVDTLRPTS